MRSSSQTFLMIALNMAAVHISPGIALAFSIPLLLGAFLLALRLPADDDPLPSPSTQKKEQPAGIVGLLVFLFLFIAVISINSGLMYQVMSPAFAHLEWLTSWYWAIPYIAALFIMRNLPSKTNRSYLLYAAISMIGLSFIGFISLERSAVSYLVVNTLMLGACGIYDLFWWSILGEMLELSKNPAKILGVGLSANVLGILLGGLIGNMIIAADMKSPNPALLALAVVCVTLALLPPLHKRLSSLLKGQRLPDGLSRNAPAGTAWRGRPRRKIRQSFRAGKSGGFPAASGKNIQDDCRGADRQRKHR